MHMQRYYIIVDSSQLKFKTLSQLSQHQHQGCGVGVGVGVSCIFEGKGIDVGLH